MKIIFLVFALSPVLCKEWEDPHDMNTNSKQELMEKLRKESDLEPDLEHKLKRTVVEPDPGKNCSPGKCDMPEDISLAYLKRFIGVIVNSAKADKGNPSKQIGKYILITDSEDLKYLSEFSTKKDINIHDLRKLDTIINEIFQSSVMDEFFHAALTAQEIMTNIINKESFILFGICVGLYIFYRLLQYRFSFGYIIKYFTVIVFIIDYGLRYKTLLEEAQVHNMKIEFTSKCDPHKMTWFEWFKFLKSVNQQNCENRVVTPLEVLLHQLKHIIIIPLSATGTGFGELANQLWTQLPFPWNLIIFPIMLIFILLIIVMVMTIMNGCPFKINLMHLFKFEFGHKYDHNNQVLESIHNLLDNVIHRPMVENVNSTKEDDENKNNNNQLLESIHKMLSDAKLRPLVENESSSRKYMKNKKSKSTRKQLQSKKDVEDADNTKEVNKDAT